MSMGQPEIGLFASRLSHQLPVYIAWKADPHHLGTDAMQQIWSHQLLYAFPPFALIPRVLRKGSGEHDDSDNTSMANSSLVPRTSEVVSRKTITNTKSQDSFNKSSVHPLVRNQTLRLAAWKGSGKSCLRKEFRKQLPFLSQVQGGMAQSLITIRPGGSGLTGVLKRKLIHFDVM